MSDFEERVQLASKEFRRLMTQYAREEDAITAELARTGQLQRGLDANSDSYVPLRRKYDALLLGVFDKYNLPRTTKLNWLELEEQLENSAVT